jgi:hypothetical protein
MFTEDTLADVQSSLRDPSLRPIIWPKLEIILGLAAAFFGLVVGIPGATHGGERVAVGCCLFVLGCYLALAGHRSHLYIFQVRTTALLLQEIRARTPTANQVGSHRA